MTENLTRQKHECDCYDYTEWITDRVGPDDWKRKTIYKDIVCKEEGWSNKAYKSHFNNTIVPKIYKPFMDKELPDLIKKQKTDIITWKLYECPIFNVTYSEEKELVILRKKYYSVFSKMMLENKNILINDNEKNDLQQSYLIVLYILSIFKTIDFKDARQKLLVAEVSDYLDHRDRINALKPNSEKKQNKNIIV